MTVNLIKIRKLSKANREHYNIRENLYSYIEVEAKYN